MQFPNFIGGAYLARSPNFAAETCINLYLEPGNATTKSPAMLLGTPGLLLFATLPSAGVRGLYTASGGRCFAVAGTHLYELAQGGTATARGTLASGSGCVAMTDNGVQLLVVDGTSAGYVLTLATNAYAAIVSAAFSGADRVAHFDGYLLLNRPGTQQFYFSALHDAATYDGLDFASDEASPDPIIALEVQRRELLILGTRSGQLWFDSGDLNNPFQPIAGTSFTYGTAAAHSLRTLGGQFYWLAQDEAGAKSVMTLRGYEPERISTPAIEYALNQYSRVDDAIGSTYQEETHAFYCLSFPTGNATWVYDSSTKLWHARADLDPSTGLFQRSRVEHHCAAFGKHLVGGANDGRVYEQDLDTYDLDGDALVAERTSPFLHQDRRLLYHALFELDLQAGVGLDGGVVPGTEPEAMLQWSDDGGHTWSHEHWVSLGAQGQYLARALWRRLGRSRQRVYRVRISDTVKRAIIGARVEVS
jgi:hypothetical protein